MIGMPNQPVMMNPNFPRGTNPNLNPNMNPNAKNVGGMAPVQPMGMMGHPSMGPGPAQANQMYG